MVGTMIGFLAGALFAGSISYYAYSMIDQAKVPEMIKAETEKRIKDLEFRGSYLEKKLSIATRERDIAIEDSKLTLKERNEALIMLSNKF